MPRIFGVAGKNGVVPLAGDGTKEQRKCCLCMRAEVYVCRSGRIKDKTGERPVRADGGAGGSRMGGCTYRGKFTFAVRDG